MNKQKRPKSSNPEALIKRPTKYQNIVSHHSNYDTKYPDEKDSHKIMANLFSAIILGIGRFVHGMFKFIFSIISSMA